MVCWVSLPLGLLVNALIALQSLGFGVITGRHCRKRNTITKIRIKFESPFGRSCSLGFSCVATGDPPLRPTEPKHYSTADWEVGPRKGKGGRRLKQDRYFTVLQRRHVHEPEVTDPMPRWNRHGAVNMLQPLKA